MKSIIGKTLLVISLLILLVSGLQYYRNQQLMEELRNKVEAEEPEGTEEQGEEEGGILLRFQDLYGENNDLAGWIRISGTVIDYPVLQFVDNAYYLNRDFYGKTSKAGSIFMDYRNLGDGSDFNTILYGHHMADGSMFKDLMNYKKEDFFHKNGIIEFDVLNKEYEWEIFSAYVTDVEFYYIDTNFPTQDKKLEFIDSIRDRSLFDSDLHVGAEDHILTLSTCTYEFDNARLVVHAKRLDQEISHQKKD